jgi:hypothetical protein
MTDNRWRIDLEFIEQGHIYFFYKPKKGVEEVSSLKDVGRFYFVLQPETEMPPRYVFMGKKQMPRISNGGKTSWGKVQKVGGRGFEITKPGKERKDAARAAGEGLYALVRHGDHTHLVYILELPERRGDVQKGLELHREGNYLLAVKPPPTVSGKQLKELKVTDSQKYQPLREAEVLNYEGAEILLTGVTSDVERLGIAVEKDQETEETADIFNQLKVSRERHPIEPLITGNWR